MNPPNLVRKRPTWIKAVAALGAVFVLAGLLLWVSRAPLAAWTIERVMDEQELCPCEVEVVAIGRSRSVLNLQRSALGSIARLEIDYRVTGDVSIAVDRLRIEGARLALAWRDGKLLPVLPSAGGTGSGTASLPVARIEIVNSSVKLTTDATVVAIDLAGTLVRDPELVANFDLAVHAAEGQLRSSFTARALHGGAFEGLLVISDGDVTIKHMAASGMTGTLRAVASAQGLTELDGKFSLQTLNTPTQAWGTGVVSVARSPQSGLSLTMQFAPLQLALHSDAMAPSSGAPFTLDGVLDARVLPGLLPGVSIERGKIAFSGAGTTPAKSTDLRSLLKSAHMQADVHAEITNLARADHTHIARIAAHLACALAAGVFTCHSAQGLQLHGISLPTTLVAADSALARISTVQLLATNDAPLIMLTTTADAHKLAVMSTLTLQSPTLAVRGPLAAQITLDAAPPVAGSLSRQGRFKAQGKLVIEGPPEQDTFTPDVELDGRFTVAAPSGALINAVLESGQLVLPAQAWAVQGVTGRYSAGDTQRLKLSIAEVRNTREPALVVPLRADLDLRISAREANFVAHLHDRSGLVDATLTGRHARRSGVGEVTLSAQPMVFTDASALSDLSPALAARGFKTRGTLTLAGKSHWGDGPPRHALSLALQAVALAGPTFKASALNGALQLDGLAPLHSGPGQQLKGVLELPSVKRVPFDLRFGLDTNQLLIEQARAEIFDGALETTAAQIDLTTNAMQIDLRVVDIDLESAFMVLNLEQLKGTGRMRGLLPLRLQDGRLAVTAGHLEAKGPGKVQIGANSVTDQLKSYGSDVDLAFRVLSDFHYQRLWIDADKALLGAGKAVFHLEGDNPGVMNKHPFVFNISLETDFDYLAKLLLELSATSNRALGWGAGEILKR